MISDSPCVDERLNDNANKDRKAYINPILSEVGVTAWAFVEIALPSSLKVTNKNYDSIVLCYKLGDFLFCFYCFNRASSLMQRSLCKLDIKYRNVYGKIHFKCFKTKIYG